MWGCGAYRARQGLLGRLLREVARVRRSLQLFLHRGYVVSQLLGERALFQSKVDGFVPLAQDVNLRIVYQPGRGSRASPAAASPASGLFGLTLYVKLGSVSVQS